MSVRSSRIVLIVLFLALGSIAADAWAREPEKSSGSYQDLVELFAAWREFQPPRLQAGVPDYTAAAMATQHRELATYQERLKALNACDFGDLLLHMLTIFQQHRDVLEQYQQRFKYILVDEYQDTNQVQYLWLRLLAQARKNICVVGDDDQSI